MAMAGQIKQDAWWSGLHLDWDDCLSVRSRIRDGAKLMLSNPCLGVSDGTVDRSVHNCRFNKHVMLPALKRWKDNGPESSPSIDHVYDEVAKLYRICLRTDVTACDIYKDAWALRKLMGLVKAQPSKQAVPQVPWPLMLSVFGCFVSLYLSHIYCMWGSYYRIRFRKLPLLTPEFLILEMPRSYMRLPEFIN